MAFESLPLNPFCLEKSVCNKWYFEVLAVFSVRVSFESGKICKNNDHICLFHCIPQEMFEHSV